MATKNDSIGSSTKAGSPAPQETSNAVATTGTAALPAFMQQHSRMGKENITAQDMVIPRVGLMQAINPEVTEGKAESGHFFHTVGEEDLGEELGIIIIHHSKRYTLWNPRHAGGGVLVRASDGLHWDADWKGEIVPYKDRPKYKVALEVREGDKVGRDIGLGKWGSLDPENPDSPPAATLTHVLVCVSPDRLEMGPFVVLLQRSAEPVAKMLLSKVNIDPAPIFGQVYTMGCKQVSSASGDFNQYTFAKNGHVQDEGLFNDLMEQHKRFAEAGVKYDEKAAQDEAETGAAAPAEADGKDAKY